MEKTLVTAPSIEPVSLSDMKEHLRIDSQSFADDITSVQCIAPGSHAVAATYSLKGTGVDVLGYSTLFVLDAGDCSGGTVDVKIQESDTDVDGDYTDWAGGAFDQVKAANDLTTYEKAYTGTKQYVRAVSTVATGACEFGVSVLKDAATSAEDDYISGLITAAREHIEEITARAFISQTWDIFFDAWPAGDMELPLGKLQSVTSVKYKDTDGDESTFSSDDYIVDTDSFLGRVVLGYGESWPTTTLYPSLPITVRIVCGYGDAATDVPGPVKMAIKIMVADLYENRETVITGVSFSVLKTVDRLLATYRIYSF